MCSCTHTVAYRKYVFSVLLFISFRNFFLVLKRPWNILGLISQHNSRWMGPKNKQAQCAQESLWVICSSANCWTMLIDQPYKMLVLKIKGRFFFFKKNASLWMDYRCKSTELSSTRTLVKVKQSSVESQCWNSSSKLSFDCMARRRQRLPDDVLCLQLANSSKSSLLGSDSDLTLFSGCLVQLKVWNCI